MDKEEILANQLLRELEKKERLKKIVHEEPGTYLSSLVSFRNLGLLTMLILLVSLLRHDESFRFLTPFLVVFVFQLFENNRQKIRLDALVELLELEKAEPASKELTGS
ncbi:MAG: hypothetical protein JJU05_16305 [Verrucomicrobia bacterium]|nr:hypothetical protein [Verrucomicrobiota bacterium]MCH8529120.1 hypothetical protein [Kiritimatiellia bacterium]